jgi:hypothetical protein
MLVFRQKSSILNSYHPENPFFREQGRKDLWLFFEAERGPRAKRLGNAALETYRGRLSR